MTQSLRAFVTLAKGLDVGPSIHTAAQMPWLPRTPCTHVAHIHPRQSTYTYKIQ